MLLGLLKHPKALLISIVLHVVLLGAFFINFNLADNPNLQKQGEVAKTIKAEVVNQQQLKEQERRKQEQQKAKQQKELDKQKKLQAEKAKAEAIKREKAEAKKRKVEAEKKKKETARKLTEAKKKAEIKKQQEAEAKRKAEEDKKKKLAETKEKEEQERLKKVEHEKQAKLAEEKRQQEEKKRIEAEKKKQAELEQKRQEAALKAKLEDEETQRRLNSLRDAYRLAIKQKIERKWLRPQESGKMPDCKVRVVQGPGGIILDVTFGSCKGASTTYRLSIENAVYKAEPLPRPGDPALFDRELDFVFRPPQE